MKRFLIFIFATYSLSLISSESPFDKQKISTIAYELAKNKSDKGIFYQEFLSRAEGNEELADDYLDLYDGKLSLNDFY